MDNDIWITCPEPCSVCLLFSGQLPGETQEQWLKRLTVEWNEPTIKIPDTKVEKPVKRIRCISQKDYEEHPVIKSLTEEWQHTRVLSAQTGYSVDAIMQLLRRARKFIPDIEQRLGRFGGYRRKSP